MLREEAVSALAPPSVTSLPQAEGKGQDHLGPDSDHLDHPSLGLDAALDSAGQALGMPLLARLDDFLNALDDRLSVAQRTLSVGKCQNLLGWLDGQSFTVAERKGLRQLLADSQPRQSKWHDPSKPGQADLYDALEKVLLQLKHFTPHSLPFLHRVSRKEVPDYYDVIKRPMDLGTMFKKLKALAYLDKGQFIGDLQLIYDNCYRYNSAPESPFRKHVDFLRDRWTTLLMNVPNISLAATSRTDEMDQLIDAHFERMLSDDGAGGHDDGDDGESSSGITVTSSIATIGAGSLMGAAGAEKPSGATAFLAAAGDGSTATRTTLAGDQTICFRPRSAAGMTRYRSRRARAAFLPELECFHQSVPDDLYITQRPSLAAAAAAPVPHQDSPIDPAIVRQCEQFYQIRSLVAGDGGEEGEMGGDVMVRGHNSMAGPTGSSGSAVSSGAKGFYNVMGGEMLDADCFQPRFASHYLTSRLGWLLLQAGFQGAQHAAMACLGDVLSAFLMALLHRGKLYMEDALLREGTVDLDALMSRLITDDGDVDRLGRMLSFLRDTPRKSLEKLGRALQIIRDRQQYLASGGGALTAMDLDADASSSALEDRVPEDDIDLGIFGHVPPPPPSPSSSPLSSIFKSAERPPWAASEGQDSMPVSSHPDSSSLHPRKRAVPSAETADEERWRHEGDKAQPTTRDDGEDAGGETDYPKRRRAD